MASALDSEIERLRARATLLRKQVQMQTSTLLTAESSRELVRQSHESGGAASTARNILEVCDAHTSHKQQSLYRAGASITAFRVRDPDPNAVDGGRVLGLRFDTMMGTQFLRPYYIFLVRDPAPVQQQRPTKKERAGSDLGPLRVHRHTVPTSIPLAGLATRYLLVPDSSNLSSFPDLYGFARAVRRALVRYHNRLAVISDLRRTVQKQLRKQQRHSSNEGSLLADVSGADAEAKQIRLDWTDGRTGRLLLDDDGDIQQLIVIGATGTRDLAAARALLSGETTPSGLIQRLSET